MVHTIQGLLDLVLSKKLQNSDVIYWLITGKKQGKNKWQPGKTLDMGGVGYWPTPAGPNTAYLFWIHSPLLQKSQGREYPRICKNGGRRWHIMDGSYGDRPRNRSNNEQNNYHCNGWAIKIGRTRAAELHLWLSKLTIVRGLKRLKKCLRNGSHIDQYFLRSRWSTKAEEPSPRSISISNKASSHRPFMSSVQNPVSHSQ